MRNENKALVLNFSKTKFQNNMYFACKKYSNFCDQISQAVAIFGKILKICIFMFFDLPVIFRSAVAFQQYQIYYNF